MRKVVLVTIIFILILSACGQEENKPARSLEGAHQKRNQSSDTPAPTAQDSKPAVINFSGYLFYLADGNLYMAGSDTEIPVLVAEDVTVAGNSLQAAILGRQADEATRYSVLDFTSLEESPLMTLPENQMLRVAAWSPTNQYFLVEISEPIVQTSTNGETFTQYRVVSTDIYGLTGQQLEFPFLESRPERISGAWLDDGTMLVVHLGSRVGESFTMWHYNPLSGESTEVEVDAVHQPTFSRLEPGATWDRRSANSVLAEYGFSLAPSTVPYTTMAFAGDNRFYVEFAQAQNRMQDMCQEYWLMQKPLEATFIPRNIYTTDAVAVSRPIIYGDYVYFLEITSLSCVQSDVQIAMVRLDLSQETPTSEVLAESPLVFPTWYTSTNFLFYEDYILWLVLDGETSQVMATDLQTGETGPILQQSYQPSDEDTFGAFGEGAIVQLLGAVASPSA